MPTLPEPNSQSESTKHPDSYYTEKVYTQQQYDELKKKVIAGAGAIGASVPIVNTLYGYSLQSMGWERNGTTYTKDGNTLVFNGYEWYLNGSQKVQFIQDLPQ